MQVRFIACGPLEATLPDGSTEIFEAGLSEIYPVEKVMYENENCEYADIHLENGWILEGVPGSAFEPMGDEIYFNESINSDGSDSSQIY